MNEPVLGMCPVILDTETSFSGQPIIAVNIANGTYSSCVCMYFMLIQKENFR